VNGAIERRGSVSCFVGRSDRILLFASIVIRGLLVLGRHGQRVG
jgi:hypothetical protein